MDYEREKKKLEAQHQAAKLRLEREDAKRRALKRQLMATAARLEDRAEKWHRFALAYADRMIGYTGQQAIARDHLRAMSFDQYVDLVRRQASDGALSLVAAELATVIEHMDELTKRGREVLLRRDRSAYEKDLSEWQDWYRQNPDKNDWRSRKVTKGQSLLIDRIVEVQNVTAPQLLNRGEAHDFIARHGGNPRLASDRSSAGPEGVA